MSWKKENMAEQHEKKKPLFRDINADEDDSEVTEIESLCVSCEKNVGD